MTRVALIPTGRLEWKALAPALARLFPDYDFYPVPSQAELDSNPGMEFPISSFTSCAVSRVMGRENNADRLIARAAYEASRADLVFILDDLELDNINQPAQVTLGVREAVERHLLKLRPNNARQRTRQALRTRVSFHLAKPMIESWIFADPCGPANAGVPSTRPAQLKTGRDLEDFETDDPTFHSATTQGCTKWLEMPEKSRYQAKKKRNKTPIWVKLGGQRTQHPKAYLAWLARSPAARNCTEYQETRGGAEALVALNWASVLPAATGAMPFLTALVLDLADGLGQIPSIGLPVGAPAPQTACFAHPENLLRNL